jgi:hypothetical protein
VAEAGVIGFGVNLWNRRCVDGKLTWGLQDGYSLELYCMLSQVEFSFIQGSFATSAAAEVYGAKTTNHMQSTWKYWTSRYRVAGNNGRSVGNAPLVLRQPPACNTRNLTVSNRRGWIWAVQYFKGRLYKHTNVWRRLWIVLRFEYPTCLFGSGT